MGEAVEIVEVGPRDGLQNEPDLIATDAKIELVNKLSAVGFRRIEIASFVNPKRVPQMADGSAVFAGIRKAGTVKYTALTPNLQGFERALESKADEIAVFASASEGFSQANLNCSISESLEMFAPVIEAGKSHGTPVRGYVSCIVECPYDGPIAPEATASVSGALFQAGCGEISLGDTIGRGTPDQVAAALESVRNVVPVAALAGHFHDTSGRALENVDVALEAGLRVFDGAAGGLGGCPFAPGAAGNLATEDLARHLATRGFQTGLDLEKLQSAAEFARALRQEPQTWIH